MKSSKSVTPQSAPARSWRALYFGGLLVICTLVAYIPAMNGQFVWDDDSWTTGIVHLLRDGAGLWSMWRHLTALQQYFPLSGTTFWVDYHLWGFHTLPYHIENVLLHALAALLVWRLLWHLKVPGAWLAAFVFALHPVMVESAAWITERKNVLSLPLYLGALLAYGRFTGFWNEGTGVEKAASSPRPSPPKEERGKDGRFMVPMQGGAAWGLSMVLFVAAMLAKTTAFSLPPVLLLLGW